jgi:hypothetical protein
VFYGERPGYDLTVNKLLDGLLRSHIDIRKFHTAIKSIVT